MSGCNPILLERGPKGEKGDTGATGPQGPAGVNGWALDGNTNAALKYIGTNDNYDFPIYTNGTQRAIVLKTGQVGIGTAVPATNLEVTANGSNSIILSTRYSADTTMSAFVSRKSRGTLSAPSAVLSGDYIGGIGAVGYHSGGAFATTSGEGRFHAAENFTSTNRGTNFSIFLAPIGGTAIASLFTLRSDGHITAGNNTKRNLTIGYLAGFDNTLNDNTFLGTRVASGAITGNNNTGVGSLVLLSMTSGTENTSIGASAMQNSTDGSYCTAVGKFALLVNGSGTFNTAVGRHALVASTGNHNTSLGASTFANLSSGDNNTGIGSFALEGMTGGSNNTSIGKSTGSSNLTGNGNVFIGYNAGFYETGSSKLFIDNAPRASEADGRAKALIYGVFDAAVANQIVAFNAHVGIGTITPTTSAALDITSTTGALLVPRMTSTQRDALTASNGMFIYNTTTAKGQIYEGGAWVNLI